MTRVKRGTIAHKRRKNVLQYTKGFRWGRKSKYRAAKEALLHAWTHAFHDRKKKKGNLRRIWNVQINAASREFGISYHQFINLLKKNAIALDRKILAQLASNHPPVFEKIVETIKKT
jgi:large subunit ribosomal protein L20